MYLSVDGISKSDMNLIIRGRFSREAQASRHT